jgi:hypothetical protein
VEETGWLTPPVSGSPQALSQEQPKKLTLWAVRSTELSGVGCSGDIGWPHHSIGFAFGGDDFQVVAWDHNRDIPRLVEAVDVLSHQNCSMDIEKPYSEMKVSSRDEDKSNSSFPGNISRESSSRFTCSRDGRWPFR